MLQVTEITTTTSLPIRMLSWAMFFTVFGNPMLLGTVSNLLQYKPDDDLMVILLQ